MRHLNLRIGEHIRILPLTMKKVKPKGSAVSDHLLLCNHSPSFENFSVLTKENRKFVLRLKGSPRIIRDKPPLNRNIRFALKLTKYSSFGFLVLDFKLLHHRLII